VMTIYAHCFYTIYYYICSSVKMIEIISKCHNSLKDLKFYKVVTFLFYQMEGNIGEDWLKDGANNVGKAIPIT
jgi:hypothetical protein